VYIARMKMIMLLAYLLSVPFVAFAGNDDEVQFMHPYLRSWKFKSQDESLPDKELFRQYLSGKPNKGVYARMLPDDRILIYVGAFSRPFNIFGLRDLRENGISKDSNFERHIAITGDFDDEFRDRLIWGHLDQQVNGLYPDKPILESRVEAGTVTLRWIDRNGKALNPDNDELHPDEWRRLILENGMRFLRNKQNWVNKRVLVRDLLSERTVSVEDILRVDPDAHRFQELMAVLRLSDSAIAKVVGLPRRTISLMRHWKTRPSESLLRVLELFAEEKLDKNILRPTNEKNRVAEFKKLMKSSGLSDENMAHALRVTPNHLNNISSDEAIPSQPLLILARYVVKGGTKNSREMSLLANDQLTISLPEGFQPVVTNSRDKCVVTLVKIISPR
jgi:hypothetical protein